MAVAGASQSVTIANNESQSGVFAVPGDGIIGLIMPAGWTTAALTFLVSDAEDGTFAPLYNDSGTEATVASGNVAASRAISLSGLAAVLAPWQYMKLRSGTAGVPVNQGAERVILVQGR